MTMEVLLAETRKMISLLLVDHYRVIALSSFLGLIFILLLAFIKIFRKQWWAPVRIQKLMALQGIKGPSYRLIHGNIKEINSMMKEARASRPKNISHDTFTRVLPHVHFWTKIYGKIFLQWFGSEAMLVVTDLDNCKEILINKDRAYQAKISYYMKKILAEDGIALSQGEQWKKLRKPADLAFHGESLKNMIPTMVACAETMLNERWNDHDGKEIEVLQEFTLLTSDMISRTAFGSSYLEGKSIFEKVIKLHSMTFKHTFRFNIKSLFFKPTAQIEAEKIEKQLHASVLEIVKKREQKAMCGEVHDFGNDYLGLLLKAHHDSSREQRISLEELVNECKAFHWLGHAFTDHLLAWTVFLLALHQDWQEKARKEVLQLFGKQTPNPQGVTKLKTMSMIINESLRLYPPFPATVKKVDKEVKLGHITVPANTKLFIPFLAFHYDPALWGEDVQLFKPERFSEGIARATKENTAGSAFLPFGMGPRTCVGIDYSTMQAKIVLSMILQRYSFKISPTYVHSPIYYLTIRPQYGVQVVLHSL